MKVLAIVFWIFCMLLLCPAFAQNKADSTLNNLVHAKDYVCSEWGTAPYQKFGSGKQSLLLLPGWGFDGSIFQEFIQKNTKDYTMYLLTLPGYGDSKAYPMPAPSNSYGEGNWMRGVEKGILNLVEKEKLDRPILIAHFCVSSHIAMRLAVEHPERFGKIVLVGAPVTFRLLPPYDTLSYHNRVRYVDQGLAPRWFKTVSQATWLNGNFPPALYSCDSLRARQLFLQANSTPLPVQIRYLCETWAADFSIYEQIKIPVLILIPKLSEKAIKLSNASYASWFTEEWNKFVGRRYFHPFLVEQSGCNIMQDQVEMFTRLLKDFIRP